MRMRLESLVFFNRTQQPPPLQQRPGGTRWKGSTYGAGDTDVSSSHKYVFYFLFFYTLLNFTFLLDYVCKQMNERPPLSNLIRERRTGTRWRGSTYGAGDVCGSSPHSTFIFLLFFYSTKFIFLLDYLIERANGHLDRHTQVPGQQRTGDSRHICLESLVFFFCYERFGRFFFFLLRFLQSKWFFVTSYKYGTTTNGHAHWHLTPHLTPHQHRAVASHGSPSLYHMISCSILVLYSFVKLIISFNFFITQFYKSERYFILS